MKIQKNKVAVILYERGIVEGQFATVLIEAYRDAAVDPFLKSVDGHIVLGTVALQPETEASGSTSHRSTQIPVAPPQTHIGIAVDIDMQAVAVHRGMYPLVLGSEVEGQIVTDIVGQAAASIAYMVIILGQTA